MQFLQGSMMNDLILRNKLENDLMKAEVARNDSLEFKTNFNFLLNHNGWRKGKLHVVIGSTSSGKSTFLRSILFDLIKNNPEIKIGIWLSEESVMDVKQDLFRVTDDMDFYKNVLFKSEIEIGGNANLIREEQKKFLNKDFGFFIFDNITTCRLYEEVSVSEQSQYSSNIKRYADERNIPVLVMAHTRTNSEEKLLEPADIRGSKNIANIAQFFYAIQTFFLGSTLFSFILLQKTRGQAPAVRIFLLRYNIAKRINATDTEYEHKEFKEMYKQRNTL